MHLRELDTNLIVVLDALLVDASVTKAAERLGRSPSAISHALGKLRDLFDDPLFVRAGQRLVLTPRAEQIAPTVHIIVSGIESLLRPTAPFDPSTQQREFQIACSETCELGILRRLRGAIATAAPDIVIHRRTLNGDATLEDLRAGKAHFIMVPGNPPHDVPDFVWQKLYDERFVTIARADHDLSKGKPAKRAFLSQKHILAAPADDGPDPVLAHFEQYDRMPADVVRVSSPFVALFLALDSDALATVPQSVADAAAASQKLAFIAQPFPKLSIAYHLGWHRSHDRDECHEWLREQTVLSAANARSE